MKLRLPLLLRLALLSTAAAYTLGSGCLFADDAPADAAQDDPIAEAVDEEESDSPAIGFEGYTESQLVDIQSSDSAGAVIRQMLENSTTGAVANVGTTSSTSNGATTAAESPVLILSAPAEPVTDTTLTTSTLSDSAGEGAVAPFFSAEEAAALVVASPATSTPTVKNASTATLSSSDSPDETTSSVVANGAVSSSIASVGSAGGAGASSGGASASYSLTSSAPDSSSSLVITTPTDDTSSDPIAEDVLEDSTTEDTTTSTFPDSSASTLATTSSTTPRSLPPLKLLGSTETTPVTISGAEIWDEDTDAPAEGSAVTVTGANASLTIRVNTNDLGMLQLNNGGDVTVSSGSTATFSQVRVHNEKASTSETLAVNGKLNITHASTATGYSDSALLIGHWPNGQQVAVNVSGGTLNVLNGWTHMTRDSKGSLTISNNGTANLYGLEYDAERSHEAVVQVDSSGRLNVGALGIVDDSSAAKASHRFVLNGGTLGVLSADGASGDIEWGACGVGPMVSVSADSVLDTAVVDATGKTTGGVGTMNFGTLTVDSGVTLTVSGGGRVNVSTFAPYEDSQLNVSGTSSINFGTLTVNSGVTLTVSGEGRVNVSTLALYKDSQLNVSGTSSIVVNGFVDMLGVQYSDLTSVKAVGADGNDAVNGFVNGSFTRDISNLSSLSEESVYTWRANGDATVELISQSDANCSFTGTFRRFYLIGNASSSLTNFNSGSVDCVILGRNAGEFTMTAVDQFNLKPVIVESGATLNIGGKRDQCFSVILSGGTLKNSGDTCRDTQRQINEIVLWDDSTIDATSEFGLVGSGWGSTTLDLGKKILTKVGSDKYTAVNTALKGGGTLKITVGDFMLGSSRGSSFLGSADDSKDTNIWLTAGTLSGIFTMNRDAEFKLDDGNTSASGTATISATITNAGKTATFEVASGDTLTFSGNMVGDGTTQGNLTKTEAGKLLLSGSNNQLAKITVSGGIAEITGSTTVRTAGSGIHLNSGSDESPVGINISGSGSLSYDSVTYRALTGQTAELRRTEKGDFSLGNKYCTVKNASLELSNNEELIKARLDGVSISTTGKVRLGYTVSDGNSLNSLTAQNIDIGYWNSSYDKGEKVHALLNGEGSISSNLQVIMTSDLTVCGELAVGGQITIGAASDQVSYIYVNDGSANLLSLRSKNEKLSDDAAASTITGGLTMKYDSSSKQAVLIGASAETGSILKNTLLEVNSGKSLLMEQNITVAAGSAVKNTAGTVKIGDGTEAASFVLEGEYTATGESALQVQENATLKLNTGETSVTTITNRDGSTEAASITGGVTMKYDSANNKAVIAGAGSGSSATITNSLLTVANGSTLSLQNVILAGSTKISAGTAAAAAVALLDEGSGESSGTATTVDLTDSVIQLSKDNATPKTGSGSVSNLTKDTTLTKTGTTGGEGNTLTIQQDTAKVYTIDYTGATGVTLTGALTFDFDTFTVEGMTGSGYYLLNELLKEYDYVALRFADDVKVDPKTVAVTSKVTMGTETVTSAGYYVANDTATSGVVVYFDAMALPEPTTSTLGLLALAALCARRRRSRTRAHAE